MDTFDLDEAAGQAWTSFQAELAEHIAQMSDDEILLLQVDGCVDKEGAAPYVQLCRWDDEVRCEAVSNAYLAAPYQLDGKSAAALALLGFQYPSYEPGEDEDAGSSNFWLDVTADDADRLAVTVVRALRHVYGVAHPALLAGHPLQPAPVAEVVAEDAPAVLFPGGHDELDAFVVKVLTPQFGHPPTRDDDGDIPVCAGTAVVYLRVHPEAPVVQLFSELVVDIKDTRAARREVERLNREHHDIKFVLRGDRIRCWRDLDAWPLASTHLEARLSRMCELAESIDHTVAAKVKGTVFNPQAERDDELPTEALPLDSDSLLWDTVDALTSEQLSARSPGDLLRLVARARQERTMWASELRSAQRYAAPWAEACREQHRAAERRYRRLRHLLRDVLGHEAGTR